MKRFLAFALNTIHARVHCCTFHSRASSVAHGQVDTFGDAVADAFENKMTIAMRDNTGWVTGPRLENLPDIGLLPAGALGYVRTKAATICRAGVDVEFHQLSGAVHVAGDAERWVERVSTEYAACPPDRFMTRGVWGADGIFYPCGVALCATGGIRLGVTTNARFSHATLDHARLAPMGSINILDLPISHD